MPPRRPDEPPPPRPAVLVPRKKWQWARIEQYPELEERIRGVDVYRTLDPAPLHYRIVISAFVDNAFRIPAVVAINNERRIRFHDARIEFGIIHPGERKVKTWLESLPDYRSRDVILSNPDFVELSTTTLAELESTNSTTDDN